MIERTLTGYLLSIFRAHQEAITVTHLNPVEAGIGFVERHLPHHAAPQPEEHTMTTPAPAAVTADSTLPWWTALHQNLTVFDDHIQAFLPKIRTIATNPALDEGVEALLAAFAGPMAPEVFAGVITLLKAAPADHMDAAIGLLTTVAHQAPAAGGGDVQAQLGAQQASGTGSQPAMAPRVI